VHPNRGFFSTTRRGGPSAFVPLVGILALAAAFSPGGCAAGGNQFTDAGSGACTGSRALCGGSCVDTATDPDHCGKCGVSCQPGDACVSGKCEATCPGSSKLCEADGGAHCVDTKTDNANCGTCGHSCPRGQVCSASRCATSCLPTEKLCGDDGGAPYCADTRSDPANCGACGVSCSGGQTCSGSPPSCACPPGLTLCGTRCVDLSSDRNNCGGCAVQCPTLDDCLLGTFVPPVAYWPFEGTLVDATGSGNDGVYQAGATVIAAPFVPGYAGQGVSFDAASVDWIEVPAPSGMPLGSGPRTLEAWVQPSALSDPTYNGILAYGVEACNGGQLLSMTQIYLPSSANWCDDLIASTGPTGANGAFSHVAFTFDGTTRSLYLNGVLQLSDKPMGIDTSPGPLRIGSTDSPGRSWTGVIDEARVYNWARSAADLLDDATLVAHYTFDAADGTDIGPNHDTATVYNTSAEKGELGQALVYNGSSSYVSAPVSQLNGPASLSVEAWFKTKTGGVVIDELGSATVPAPTWHDSWVEVATSGEVNVRVYMCTAVKAGKVTFGAWTHVAVVYDAASSMITGYVNGIAGASGKCTREYPGMSGTGQFLALGSGDSNNMGNGAWFTGDIDEVRVYSRVRTSDEILFDATP
jgi:Concanavalin A-like lectin/glucanases superfamily/Stigma-specific protein, Stig1